MILTRNKNISQKELVEPECLLLWQEGKGEDMFLNTAIFKRMVKNAFNTCGLAIGKEESGIFLEGGHWVIWIQDGCIPNKEKAALIELVGELPEQGEVFRAYKGSGNQYEINWNDAWKINENMELANQEFEVTDITIDTSKFRNRILQNKETNKIVTINEMYSDLIDYEAMDQDKETKPIGPVTVNGAIFFWKNEVCTIAICGTDLAGDKKIKRVTEYLEGINLGKERGE